MQAIILAGGFGTRLKSVIGDVIKPMAPVAGRPFLCWLLEYMASQGVREVMLCLHHKPEQITSYFGKRYAGITLRYVIEDHSLGTGGALMNAMRELKPNQPVFALNGDSLVMVNYQRMMADHKMSCRPITIASTRMPDCRRYSQLDIENNCITHYELYGDEGEGDISVGFYVLSPDVFDSSLRASIAGEAIQKNLGWIASLPKASQSDVISGFAESIFSFERDFLAPNVPEILPVAYSQVDYFIDIGIPEDFNRGCLEIPKLLGNLSIAA